MQDTNLNRASTDERIDPATENLQRDLLAEFGRNSKRSTDDVKFQALTLTASTVGTPEVAHGCNSVKVMTALSDCYIGDKDGQPVLLIASIWLEIPINNVGQLRFLSATGGAVYIISSN
jgi:hypothetical protein